MQTDAPFVQFARRLTRGYVVLAVALIALVVGATSTLAFVGYAGYINDAVASTRDRAAAKAANLLAKHETFEQMASQVAGSDRHSRVRVTVFDASHGVVAGTQEHPGRIASAIADLLDIHSQNVHLAGGTIHIEPDLDSFEALLGRYWLFILPIGAAAVIAAWLIGWRITRRAIDPLVDVTGALHTIAGGDFAPKPVLESNSDLRALTTAYNEVSFRLSAATVEQRRQEAEMRQFIADAGHELRTPLTIFMGYLEALRDGVVTDEPGVARVHETMLDQSRRMRTIIEKLILLARLERDEAVSREPIALGALAARAVDALQSLAGDRIKLAVSTDATIVGDDDELYEALKNVIENAVKYAPNSPVEVGVVASTSGARIVVSDRGPGMDPVDVEHSFDRFYRGSERANAEGSGLGLAIAKRAVGRAGGTIAVTSKRGEGTSVEIKF